MPLTFGDWRSAHYSAGAGAITGVSCCQGFELFKKKQRAQRSRPGRAVCGCMGLEIGGRKLSARPRRGGQDYGSLALYRHMGGRCFGLSGNVINILYFDREPIYSSCLVQTGPPQRHVWLF